MFAKYDVENNYNVLFLYINKTILYVSELIYIIIYINLSPLNKNFGSILGSACGLF